jgi:hypothetical protein
MIELAPRHPTDLFGRSVMFARGALRDRDFAKLANALENSLPTRHKYERGKADNSNVIPIDALRRRHAVDTAHKADSDGIPVSVLTAEIGPKLTLMLLLMGFDFLEDISRIHPMVLASLPSVGPATMNKIKAVMESYGCSLGSGDRIDSGYMDFCEQLELDI